MFFKGTSLALNLHKGPELRTHNWWDREEKKSPALGGIWTHDLSLLKRALYHCATTDALKFLLNIVSGIRTWTALDRKVPASPTAFFRFSILPSERRARVIPAVNNRVTKGVWRRSQKGCDERDVWQRHAAREKRKRNFSFNSDTCHAKRLLRQNHFRLRSKCCQARLISLLH